MPRRPPAAPLSMLAVVLTLTAAGSTPGFEAAPAASPRLPLSDASRAFYARPITTWFDGHPGTTAYLQVDRPLYRPGDTVSFRAWELGVRGFTAAMGERTVRLLDPRGGAVASVVGRGGALRVPEDAPGGEWKLQLMDGTRTVVERLIVVRTVEIPKLKLALDVAPTAVVAGATVTVPFEARRATGEALGGVRVHAQVGVGGLEVETLERRTDAEGRVRLAFTVPENVGERDVSLTVLVEDGGITESITRAIPVRLDRLTLSVFPEGGNLVQNVASRVYFQVTDAHGQPAAAEGTVTDQLGGVAASWTTAQDGRGSVMLTPEPGRSYRLVTTVGPQTVSPALPTAQPDGCVLRTYADVDGASPAVRAEVSCASPRSVVVVGTQRESLFDVARVDVEPDRPAVVYLTPTDPAIVDAPGLARVTLFDGQTPLAERVVFRNRAATLQVEIAPERAAYEPGQSVGLRVQTRTRAGIPVAADLALSVVDDNLLSFADDDAPDLVARALLASEVPGPLPDARRYFDTNDPTSAAAMDLLLATRGWRRLDWPGMFVAEAKARAAVDTTSGKGEPVLTKEFLERIPTGRSYQSAVSQTAGVVGHASAAPKPAPVRVVPLPVLPTLRTDFRETVYWTPEVHTDATGTARVTFPLSDAVGSFRVRAEGVGGGLVGSGEALFASHLPLALDVKLPDAMTQGDRPLLPILVTNDSGGPLDVTLHADWGGLLLPRGELNALHVAAGERASAWLPLEVVAAQGSGWVTITGRADGHQDAFARAITVSPGGFPQTRSLAGTLALRSELTFELPEWLANTLAAEVKFYPSVVATMVDGLEGMLREPTGCFEQASSANYPNVMVLRYLGAQPGAESAVASRARGLLGAGYRKLTGYEAGGGGYEWFGASPGHEALTAYGLLEFSDMRGVYPEVDAHMVDRTALWLIGSRRDGHGGYLRNARALDSFGRASPSVTDAYITWSLAEAGYSAKLGPELKALAAQAATSQDPYVLALAVGALGKAAPDAARAPMGVLLALQAPNGSFPGAAESITRSTGPNLLVETTALAALALIDANGPESAVRSAIDWLVVARQGSGTWGATQATVLALRALTTYAVSHRSPTTSGGVELRVNGEPAGAVRYEAGQEDTIHIDGFASLLRPGTNVLELYGRGGASLPFAVDVTYRTQSPVSDPSTAVDLTTSLDRDRLRMGETVVLRAAVRNVTRQGQPMTLARIGIPGGLSAQDRQIRALRDAGRIDFYETRPREVDLYWRGLGPGERRDVDVELVATVPGRYTSPASSAYLYYSDNLRDWEAPVTVEIEP